MDFTLTDDQKQIVDAARKFAVERISESGKRM